MRISAWIHYQASTGFHRALHPTVSPLRHSLRGPRAACPVLACATLDKAPDPASRRFGPKVTGRIRPDPPPASRRSPGAGVEIGWSWPCLGSRHQYTSPQRTVHNSVGQANDSGITRRRPVCRGRVHALVRQPRRGRAKRSDWPGHEGTLLSYFAATSSRLNLHPALGHCTMGPALSHFSTR